MIEARVKLGPLDRVLSALRAPDLRPVWRAARGELRRDIRDHRAKRMGPTGAWPARAAASATHTVNAKGKRRARQPLGKLPTALMSKASRLRFYQASRVPWSDIHQKGGRAARGAKIPARPFLWYSPKALEATAAITARHLAGKLKGR